MTMSRILVVSITALIAAAGPAVAAAGDVKVAMRPVTSFGYLDGDKDQRISPEEAQADYAVAQGFEQADANRDGVLDRDEFAVLSKI